MNTKNNQRRRESMKRMESAFLQLLQNKDLNEIKVSELCKICGFNRSTFYANYVDLYDLADKVRKNLEMEVKRLYQEETSQKFNSNNYLKLFYHIKENQKAYSAYFKLGYDHQFQIYQYDTQLAEQHFGNQHIEYHIAFFKSGLNAIIKMWLENGCKETPEEMEQMILSEYSGRI